MDPKKEKKEKDKKSKDESKDKSKDKGDAKSAEKKDKSKDKSKDKESKDKSESKSKKDKTGGSEAASAKDILTSGSTTYRRHVTKDPEGKKLKCWAPEGRQLSETQYVWIEAADTTGSKGVYYVNMADKSKRVWELPDIGGNAAGPAQGTDAPMVFVEEKHFKERKEFKEKEAKLKVVSYVKKTLMDALDSGAITKEEYSLLTMNLSKEYMSLFKKFDADGEKWVKDNAAAQLAEVAEKKKAYAAQLQQRSTKNESLSGKLSGEEEKPLPDAPVPPAQRTFPSSPLLSRAWYLKDPYYYRRINRRNPNRTDVESKLEDTVFMQPGAGIVKILCSVRAKSTDGQEKELFASVVRDWAGAYCFMCLVQAGDGEFAVNAAYPLLEYVEFEKSTETKGTLSLDDLTFGLAFPNATELNYFVDSLRVAMCAMYGSGGDDTRTVLMRAYALEFSSMESSYFPRGVVPDVRTVMAKILSEETKEGQAMNDVFAEMRLCMRTPEGRDACLRAWVRSTIESSAIKAKKPASIANHIRVIEEANRHPTYHVDLSIPASVVAQLALLRADQPDTVKARIENARTTFRLMTPIMEQWRSRSEIPDRPFEAMFEPTSDTQAARNEEIKLMQRRTTYAQNNLLPGIYVTLLCYCGNSILCHPQGNLYSEVIVPCPSRAELEALTSENDDFRWILSIGGAGAPADWAISEVTAWCDVYENAGRSTFRAKFLHAARRLFEELHVPSLGCVFDIPVIHRQVSTAHIVCVLKVDTRDIIPASVGEWRNTTDFEAQLYLQTCTASHSARVEHLSTSYYDCIRSVKAAINYRESTEKVLPPGFYIGLLAVTMSSTGPMILVPETNRNMAPFALISDEMPTLEQWRWIQGLNERKRRTRTFGLVPKKEDEQLDPIAAMHVTSHYTFEQRFAKALTEVEAAVGVEVEKFHDFDLFVLDEERQRRAVFGVHFVPPSAIALPNNRFVCAVPPNAKVPMVWKHVSVIDDAYFRLHWPRTFSALIDERTAHLRRAVATCQPFATDEVARLQYESSLAAYCDVDKYGMLVSWLRPIISWLSGDSRTLVELYGGSEDAAVARSIDEAVEIAVSNYATTQDINVQTMKALLLESASTIHFSWPTLLSKLREIDRVVALGYSQRLVNDIEKKGTLRKLKVRTFDERYSDPDSDEEVPRAPTDYDLPCTLEELILKDTGIERAERYFQAQELVHDIVELACIQCVEVGEVKEIGNIIADMITVIESTEDLVDSASLVALRQEAEEAALNERKNFQQHWLEVFQNDAELQEAATKRPGLDAPQESPTRALLQQEVDEDFDNPLRAPLYCDGSTRAIHSFEEGVRVCMAKAHNTAHALETLLRVCTSAVSALEVVQTVQEYSTYLSKREALVKRPEHGVDASRASAQAASPARAPDVNTAAVTVVSKEFVEHPVAVVDPLRCLVLHNVTGKVRFPTVPTAALEVLADHLNQSDFNVPVGLNNLRPDKNTAERLLEVALQMKAPLLALRLATLIFGTQQGPTYFFTGSAALQLRTLLQDGFIFEYGIKDWLHMEVLGGDPVIPALDVLWWIRYLKEAVAEVGDRRDSFNDHEGSWKQVYAETRIRVFLSFGVHALSKEEVSLWAHSLGRYVEYLSLKDSSVGDAEVEILCQCCPNLRSLDLGYSSVTTRAVEAIIQHCSNLIECSVEGCDVPASAQDLLRRHCVDNRSRLGA